ncbi:4972_t:CDS:2, partial [Acaulospora colombiana]
FESNAGWIYWTWKAENADEWSYSAGLSFVTAAQGYGTSPDLAERIYGLLASLFLFVAFTSDSVIIYLLPLRRPDSPP